MLGKALYSTIPANKNIVKRIKTYGVHLNIKSGIGYLAFEKHYIH